MGNSRSYIFPTRQVSCPDESFSGINDDLLQAHEVKIRCRLYSTARTRPMPVVVCARSDRTQAANRYPYIESLFEDSRVQPYIHNCIVRVHEGSITHQFMVFFKRHCHLPVNDLVSCRGCIFRGDVVVTRVAVRNVRSVVNMRGRDALLADCVMSRSVFV